MLKKTLLTAMIAVLILAVPAMAGVDLDGTPWDEEFDGTGDPTAQGWTMSGSTNYDWNTKHGDGNPIGGTPGWLHANGNVGSTVKVVPSNLTEAAGWTVEWRFFPADLGSPQPAINYVVLIIDPARRAFVDYDQSAGTVTLWDPEGVGTVTVALDLTGNVERTYRLVKQPASATVDLYIDNDFSSPAASLALAYKSSTPLNTLLSFAESDLEASWDFWRVHSGATPPTKLYGDVNLDGLVGGVDITRIIANWGAPSPTYSQGDVSSDGAIGAADYNAVLNNWAARTPPEPPEAPGGGAIPEPSTLFLLAGGVLAGLIRRR